MKRFISVYTILPTMLACCTEGKAQIADAMFRGNPAHNNNDKGFDDQIFNKPAWQFKTGGAVRSTPVAANGILYFGSSDGYLYALNKNSGALQWKYNCGSSVTSSPAYCNKIIYILSEQQNLVALEAATGRLVWNKTIGEDTPYDWGFDYYFSSPIIDGDTLFIASADGKLLSLNKNDGRTIWQFQAKHFIRATPAVADGWIYIGDTNGDMYAIDSRTGKQKWMYGTLGSSLNNDTIGFDRKAIISSAVVEKDVVVFGGRDGFLYCINRFTGKLNWKFDHQVSWVISSPSIIGGHVITGTSDGHFIQSVDINTGKEAWRVYGNAPVWSSPLIVGRHAYIGGNEGVLHCIDINEGKKLPHPFVINAKIFTSPVLSDGLMYIGADDGVLYCLKPEPINNESFNRYVFWQQGNGFNFRNGVDIIAKDFLTRKGYTAIDHDQLLSIVSEHTNSGKGNIIVLLSVPLPKEFLKTDSINVLHEFMQSGGMLVDVGNNPIVFDVDDKGNFNGFNYKRCDTIIGIPYAENDLRSLAGLFTATATAEGKQMGIKDHWVSVSPVNRKNVDILLGVDEKGRASAWAKKNGSGYFIQLWIDPVFPEDYNFVDEVIKNMEKK